MRAFLERISPLTNAEQDPQAAVRRAGPQRPARAATPRPSRSSRGCARNGTPVWYLRAENEGHGFARKENADYQFYATVRFLQETLLK